MFIADGHCDTLYMVGVSGNSLLGCTVTPQRLKAGGVTLQTCAMWSGRAGSRANYSQIIYSQYQAVKTLQNAGLVQVDDPSEAVEGKQQFMLSMEGCEVFQDGIGFVAKWRERGMRIGNIVWNNENKFATPAVVNQKTPMTREGVRIVKEMQRVGIAVDASHLNDQGFFDLFDLGGKPPMASHSCCRHLCDQPRNLTDRQIRMMIDAGGYIGVNFYPEFLSPNKKATCEDVVNHIDHICQLGGGDIVGFGSDYDGIKTVPSDLRHPGELVRLFDALDSRGYSMDAIKRIAGLNFKSYFDRIR